MKKYFFLLFLSLSSLAVAESENYPAPFGLTWGMSDAELIKLGFSEVRSSSEFTTFTSVSVPKAWSKADEYIALTYQNKLVKLMALSKNFTSDIYGIDGKAEYEHIKSLLIKKYGEPDSSIERSGLKVFKESDEFYQCLKYEGCGYYYSLFKLNGGYISVSLKGVSRGTGYITISYESPAFYQAKEEVENRNSAEDTQAL